MSLMEKCILTHSFPIHPFQTHENIRKPSGFLMFSEGREKGALGMNGLRFKEHLQRENRTLKVNFNIKNLEEPKKSHKLHHFGAMNYVRGPLRISLQILRKFKQR